MQSKPAGADALRERDDRFDEIADMVGDVVGHALELTDMAKESIGKLSSTSIEFSRVVNLATQRLGSLEASIPNATYAAVAHQFDAAAQKATNSISSALGEANDAAKCAAAVYQQAGAEAAQAIRDEARQLRERLLFYVGGGFFAGFIACLTMVIAFKLI